MPLSMKVSVMFSEFLSNSDAAFMQVVGETTPKILESNTG